MQQSVINDVQIIAERVDKLEFRRMFSGDLDQANCFVDIQSGAGGTEAQDWPKSCYACICVFVNRVAGKPS